MGIRRSVRDTSTDHLQRFVDAVVKLKDYHKYVVEHARDFHKTHANYVYFLKWHRDLLTEFEKDLQTINADVMIPYWDWDVDTTIPALLGGDCPTPKIGGNPWPVVDKCGKNLNRPLKRCVKKVNVPGTAAVAAVLQDGVLSSFAERLSAIHDVVHSMVGGDMESHESPNDPLFYLHHANVDRIWAVWQKERHHVPQDHQLPDDVGYA